jgi:transposase
MACTYPTAFRESACKRMLAGERPENLGDELEVSAATLYRWTRQALIDAGRKPGLKSYEPDELARARRRIKELETELELVKAARPCSTATRWCARKDRPGRSRTDRSAGSAELPLRPIGTVRWSRVKKPRSTLRDELDERNVVSQEGDLCRRVALVVRAS